MKLIEDLQKKHLGSWENFVQSHEWGQCYHSLIWKKLIEKSFSHIKPLYTFAIEEKTKKIQAVFPLSIVKSKIIGDRLVSIPFGAVCDPLFQSKDQIDLFLDHTFKLKDELGCKRIELKLYFSSHLIKDSRIDIKNNYKHHYLTLDQEINKIFKNIKRQARQSIKKALNLEITLHTGKTEDELKDFYILYLKTRKRNRVPAQPFYFFKNLWSIFNNKGLLTLLLAKKDDLIIGGGILIKFKNRVILEFLASDQNYLSYRANHFIVWNAIKIAHKEGYEIFDFGRTLPEDKGLMRFKSSWGTSVDDIYVASNRNSTINPYDHKSFERKFIEFLAGNLPLPLYRILNNFCYRHLG